MNGDFLSQNLPMVLLALGIILFFVYKSKKRKEQEVYIVAYAGYSEAATDASEDLLAAFDGMLPDEPKGKSLLRLSLMNRGERILRAEDFQAPILLTLPQGSRVLEARAVQSTDRGLAVDDLHGTADGDRLTIDPFQLRGRSSVIFNILIDGPAEPFEIEGRFDGQTALEPLT